MTKHCSNCGYPFRDKDDIIAVVRSNFAMIPSRVSFAITQPTDIYELQHYECAKGDLLPDDFSEGVLD